MIPLFVGYALLVWFSAARWRRALGGFAAVAVGLAGLIGIHVFHWRLSIWSGGTIYFEALQTLLIPYTLVVTAVAVFIACLPRRGEHGCRVCGYELRGLDAEARGITCPECGAIQRSPAPMPVYRPSGLERRDLRASDGPARASVVVLPAPTLLPPHDTPREAQNQNQRRQPAHEKPAERRPVRV